MITEEKIVEVRKQIRSGVPEGEIREELINSGYSEEDIIRVFAPKQYDMRSWYLVSAVVLLLIGLWSYLRDQSLMVCSFSGLMFIQYYRETEKFKKRKNPDDTAPGI